MSQHKYNDAYNKGFEDGKKKAFDDWVYQCYDELSPKEQIELLLSRGAELPKKAVIQELEEVGAKIKARMKNYRKEQSEIIWDTADITNGIFEQTSYGQGLGLKEALEIIDRKIAEVTKNES